MEYGRRELRRGARGADVVELQMRLAGFRGTVPDGDFGPGTERQVRSFQQDFMGIAPPGVHYAVRCYEPKDLQDRLFCTTLTQLDTRRPIRF